MHQKLLVTILFFLIIPLVYGQKATISGYIEVAESGERMIGATVYDKRSMEGTTSNNYGFFSLQLNAGNADLIVSYLGYEKINMNLNLTRDTVILFKLIPSVQELNEIEVTAEGPQSRVKSSQMSMIEIPVETFTKLPVLFGETDVLRVIQLMPGVQSGTEGSMGLYVRGGGPDQNLFLLDGVSVYNASHLFGFMSVYNPDAVKSVQLYKGGFPARYGERLSSVVDIRMKEGNEKEYHGNFSIGLVSSKLSVEGPIKKDKTSFILSARRTYIDILTRPVIALLNTDSLYSDAGGYYFYDFNAKLNHKFSEKSRLFLSSYLGKDKLYYKQKGISDYTASDGHRFEYIDKFEMGWGNTITALRWNYLLSNKLFSNTTLTFSNYIFDITNESTSEDLTVGQKSRDYFRYYSGIMDAAAKIDFEYYPNSGHSIRFGAGNTFHYFRPGVTGYKYDPMDHFGGIDTTYGEMKVFANQLTAYAEDDMDITPWLKMNLGLRFSHFNVQDTNYLSLQPRIAVRVLASDNLSFKFSYSRMSQFVHLLTTTSVSLPTDLWLPVTRMFEPPVSDQVAFGSSFRLPWKLDMTVEAFYKTMKNLIEYKEGASFTGSGAGWESKVEKGKGWAYGIEFLLEKKTGNTTGWIGYTLSKTDRQFENLNFGRVFPAKYDRRHDISVAVTHKFNDRMDLGMVWVYGTGNTATLGILEYPALGSFSEDYHNYFSSITEFPSRNNYRTPSYHRMDLSFNIHKEKKRGTGTWSFSIYNAYNRKNSFFLFWDNKQIPGFDPSTGQWVLNHVSVLKKVSLFPIIPSVSYSFNF